MSTDGEDATRNNSDDVDDANASINETEAPPEEEEEIVPILIENCNKLRTLSNSRKYKVRVIPRILKLLIDFHKYK
jgi:hypothetical protein